MKHDGIFKKYDLNKCYYQYKISWKDTIEFKKNQKVFLKSNPEHIMYVFSIEPDNIIVRYKDNHGNDVYDDFPPQCLLQYDYSSLLVYKNKYDICLN